MINSVEIKNLDKIYNKEYILKNINLTFKKGEITAILGADGSGKTTLLRIILGLLHKTNGKVVVLSKNPIKDRNKILSQVGYMPQKFGLYEELTVLENLNLYSKLKNTKNDYDELLNFTRLKPFVDRFSGDLSGGMKQKLALACALLSKPKLLVLDEPSVGVDPLSRLELLELVNKMINKNTCVIWSSSYLDEAFNFKKSVILDKGKIIFNDETKKLGNDYKTFEKNVIKLMGGYSNTPSIIAKNYNVIENNLDCVVIADKLSKKYGNFYAVKENSFCIKKGEIFGLLGPNGAGKSTTFQMMCGLIKITSGKGYIMNIDIQKNPTRVRSYLGYMAQKFSLYSKLTVLDNLNFFAGVYGLCGKNKQEKINEMIKVFELEKYKNVNSFELPLGFKQRLSLACALIHQPPVLFLDEPTSGVDIVQRQEFWNHIKSLAKIGVSVLVTTHFMEEAKFCDKISLFYNGEIIALDTPSEIIKKSGENNMQNAFIKFIKIAQGNI